MKNSKKIQPKPNQPNDKNSAQPNSSQPTTKKPTISQEFIEFINRGSAIELAVGILIGSSFSKIVSSLVSDIVMPIVSIFIGGVKVNHLSLDLPNLFNNSAPVKIAYGSFLQNVLDFLIIATVIFFIIRFFNKLSRITAEKAKQAALVLNKPDQKSELKREITKIIKS